MMKKSNDKEKERKDVSKREMKIYKAKRKALILQVSKNPLL